MCYLMFVLLFLKRFLETYIFHMHLEKPAWKEMFSVFAFYVSAMMDHK